MRALPRPHRCPGPNRGSAFSGQHGFTVVELVVVLMLIGLLAALAAPRLTDRSALQERGVQDQLRGLLRSARQVAVTQEREVCVLLAAAQARAVYGVGGGCPLTNPVSGHGGEATLALQLPPQLAMGGATLVRFNARGQPVPATDQVITVGSLSLTVSRETGLVF
jgi:MSHA pilin protein MshC